MTAVAAVVAEIAEAVVVEVVTAEAAAAVETEGRAAAVVVVAGKRSLKGHIRFEITEKIIQDVTTQKIKA